MTFQAARTFKAEGSDLLMGVGGRAMALGGAVVAGTGDVYSTYWNPAGLVEADGVQLSAARQLNAELVDVNFAGLVLNPDRMKVAGMKAAVALSWITRLHVEADGHFGPEDLETVFLRFALPGLPDDFEGAIESKTRDYRLSLALSPVSDPRWSLGATVSRVDCRTDFCGVTADDPGNYKVASTDATTVAFNLGAKLKLNEKLSFGANLKDVDTRLHVEVTVTDQTGTSTESFVSRFPKDLTLGFLWKQESDLGLEVDYQTIFGDYGSSRLDFRMVRAGLEKIDDALSYRLGLLIPLRIESESTGDVRDEMPLPFSITLGAGWQTERLRLDLALYPHPVMSYGRERIYPAADLSIGYQF
ncbi:MAG: hypothetical protein ABIF09_09725 [Gemmatimonadota bacterium]